MAFLSFLGIRKLSISSLTRIRIFFFFFFHLPQSSLFLGYSIAAFLEFERSSVMAGFVHLNAVGTKIVQLP
jgi:hypothetical protein